jgi:hypothetical protein
MDPFGEATPRGVPSGMGWISTAPGPALSAYAKMGESN